MFLAVGTTYFITPSPSSDAYPVERLQRKASTLQDPVLSFIFTKIQGFTMIISGIKLTQAAREGPPVDIMGSTMGFMRHGG